MIESKRTASRCALVALLGVAALFLRSARAERIEPATRAAPIDSLLFAPSTIYRHPDVALPWRPP
ncbi:MAG: hypothetical protein AAF961_09910, partial [Planctomycetota bacterium]